ncbi:MAG: RNA polymerase sigma factor [Prolixibacteraceae bacterium]|nr:RNA polymerase sigma factor [Prolixibacteraceae bacterium]MBN2649328.1 RNA polymerase sigma factor [Prolixibacteraceae bacterium]
MQTESLINRLKQENTKRLAFHELVKTYQEKLYWHIRKIVIGHDDTDDVLQNTFIKVWNNIESFREESGLYTWLFRIATNEALTFLSQKKRRSIFSGNFENDYLINSLVSDEYFEGSEIQLKLQKAIIKLPDKQRLVFNMKYFDEMKYEDMSKILDTSVGALKASYHHAVKKIEEQLKQE